MELERQGRGDEETKALLYEEREVKDWNDTMEEVTKPTDSLSHEHGIPKDEDNIIESQFIDHRPQTKDGVKLSSFTFQNLPKVQKSGKMKYSWRARLEAENARKHKKDEMMDFESSGDESDSQPDESESESEGGSEASDHSKDSSASDNESVEEWLGFEDEKYSSLEEVVQKDLEVVNNASIESESGSDDDGNNENEKEEVPTSKGAGFKMWANKIIKEQNGDSEPIMTPIIQSHADYKPIDRPEDREATPPEQFIPIDEKSTRKAFFVDVQRTNEIQEQRLQLPVVGEEHRIMEAIYHNDCIILCGETGSGKTTQVPQFLFEAGFGTSSESKGMIGVTQPRRVAAVAMSERVATELGETHKFRVGHQIRFDSTVKKDTAIKFMTDGVLLREMMNDLLLKNYSVVIIDEAHERNVNTDILIGMLSRVVKLRREMSETDKLIQPLKLIIMSATLRVGDFTENRILFQTPPPVLNVEARQYPVGIHFNKRTVPNYSEEAFKKVSKIHKRLPPGGILVFMTGQNEITNIVKRLRKEFSNKKKDQIKGVSDSENIKVQVSARNTTTEVEEIEFGNEEHDFEEKKIGGIESEVDDYDADSDEEDGFEEVLAKEEEDQVEDLFVLPLYSLLPTKEQMKVFQDPPANSRLCIIATNVAETSLTIPGIRYVVDCGRVKEREFDENTGVQRYNIKWISKASAGQRAGRAGRTGPGHCYRLYSSAVYESDFDQFTKPEILRMPVEGVVLLMKSMGIDNVIKFPFPTPPDRVHLAKAEKLLIYLNALDDHKHLTELGKNMSLFPISPRYSKMLIIGDQFECMPYIIAIVAGLSVGDPFIYEQELGISNFDDSNDTDSLDKEEKRQLRQKYFKAHAMFSKLDSKSDAMKLLSAICAYDYEAEKGNAEIYVKRAFLKNKIMQEIQNLRKQLHYIVAINTQKESIAINGNEIVKKSLKLKPPSKVQLKALKQMIAAGFIDQIAARADLISVEVKKPSRNRVIDVPYKTLLESRITREDDEFVYIHSSSMLNYLGDIPPDYLVYQSLHGNDSSKIRLRPLVDITGSLLTNVAKKSSLLAYSKPLGYPYAPKMISSTERDCWVKPRLGPGVGWELPVIHVKQKKQASGWVVVE